MSSHYFRVQQIFFANDCLIHKIYNIRFHGFRHPGSFFHLIRVIFLEIKAWTDLNMRTAWPPWILELLLTSHPTCPGKEYLYYVLSII